MRGDLPDRRLVVADDDIAGRRIELACRLQQHMTEEVAGIGLGREPLEVAADHGIGLRQLRHALLGRLFALPTYGLDQPLAVQARANDTSGGLKRGNFCRIDGTSLAGVIESQCAKEPIVDEDGHDGLGQRAAIDRIAAAAGILRIDHDRAARTQLAAGGQDGALGAAALVGIVRVSSYPRRGPLRGDYHPGCAIRAGFGTDQADAIGTGGFAELAQYAGDGVHDMAGLEQHAAGSSGSCEQTLAVLQRFADLRELRTRARVSGTRSFIGDGRTIQVVGGARFEPSGHSAPSIMAASVYRWDGTAVVIRASGRGAPSQPPPSAL
jgi:hypothetical protein